MKINETESRILLFCRVPRRPKDVWFHWNGRLSYNYIAGLMTRMAMLDLMAKRQIRERGKNATFYTSTELGLGIAEKSLKSKM